MYDERPVGTHFNQPTLLTGRLAGAGANVPTPVANVKDAAATRLTFVQNATGNYTATFLDTPLGVVQSYDWWVASPANNKQVQVTPPGVNSYAFTMIVAWAANGVAVNVAAGEELVFEVWTARTQVP